MATKPKASVKHLQIDKANLAIVIVVSVACFLTIFSLVASKTLIQQFSYQSKVIDQKTTARKTLQANLQARDQLVTQYKAFLNTTSNMIGGSVTGQGDRDGDNAKIVLDALPSKYDFPAVATSLEKLLVSSNLSITSISGSDDELAQAAATTEATAPVEMPFEITFDGSSEQVGAFFDTLKRTIRPIKVHAVTITGNDAKVSTNLKAVTYYQPEKSLNIKTEVVR